MVEQLICNQLVGGSSPSAGSKNKLPERAIRSLRKDVFIGEILKRPTRADCKSAGFTFAGSNPALPTFAEVAQLVEHQPSKLRVASSNLVFRSKA